MGKLLGAGCFLGGVMDNLCCLVAAVGLVTD